MRASQRAAALVVLSGFWTFIGALTPGCATATGSRGAGGTNTGGDGGQERSRIRLSAPDVGAADARFHWAQVDQSGVRVALDDPEAAEPSFEIPDVNAPTVLRFAVAIVADDVDIKIEIEVTIRPTASAGESPRPQPGGPNRAPLADATEYREAMPGEAVRLDASGSSDPDGDPLTFAWRQISGGADAGGVLTESSSAQAFFIGAVAGIYLIAVDVSDGQFSTRDVVAVKISAMSAPPPGDERPMALPTDRDNPISTFDQDDDGWLVVGNSITRPTWEDSGGRSGGFMWMKDVTNAVWYWDAPPAFLGDVSAAYGRFLSFDLSQSTTDSLYQEAGTEVILRGAGLTLYFNLEHPGAGWTSYTVELNEDSGWRNGADGELVTGEEMLAVLSSLRQLVIRGDYSSSQAEAGGLDNVQLDLTS